MAVNQIKGATAEHDNESQGSTPHDNSSHSTDDESLSCGERAAVQQGDLGMIMRRMTRRGRKRRATLTHVKPPFLRRSTSGRKNSGQARRARTRKIPRAHAHSNAGLTTMMMKQLRSQLDSLGSLLPPAARSSRPSSVVADALRYRKVLEKEVEVLSAVLLYSQQVDVKRVECGSLQISVSCGKKPGLMVALMETMESFGLQFNNLSVSCEDDRIIIEAVSSQENVGKAETLKGLLVATILRFSQS